MRYGIMFSVKGKTENRKITVMDFQMGRMITFYDYEINGNEMEEDLKDYLKKNLDKLNTGYWDYSGKGSVKPH